METLLNCLIFKLIGVVLGLVILFLLDHLLPQYFENYDEPYFIFLKNVSLIVIGLILMNVK